MIYYIHYYSSNPRDINQKLLDAIKEFPGWAILAPTFFLVRVGEDKEEEGRDANLFVIKNRLNKVCEPEDEFFIGQMGNEATWQGYGSRLRDWLIKNFNPQNEQEQESFKRPEVVKDAEGLAAAVRRNKEIQKLVDEQTARVKAMDMKIDDKTAQLLNTTDEMLKKLQENQYTQLVND